MDKNHWDLKLEDKPWRVPPEHYINTQYALLINKILSSPPKGLMGITAEEPAFTKTEWTKWQITQIECGVALLKIASVLIKWAKQIQRDVVVQAAIDKTIKHREEGK